MKPQSPGFKFDPSLDNQADRYRHGIKDRKVAFNALYCDGHAATLTTIEQLFLGVRMRLTP